MCWSIKPFFIILCHHQRMADTFITRFFFSNILVSLIYLRYFYWFYVNFTKEIRHIWKVSTIESERDEVDRLRSRKSRSLEKKGKKKKKRKKQENKWNPACVIQWDAIHFFPNISSSFYVYQLKRLSMDIIGYQFHFRYIIYWYQPEIISKTQTVCILTTHLA